jgi:hypothetical protein
MCSTRRGCMPNPALRREALLRGAGIVLGPLDAADTAPRLETLAHAAVPVIAYGLGGWDPRWSGTPPLLLDALHAELRRARMDGHLEPGADPAEVTAHFVLGPARSPVRRGRSRCRRSPTAAWWGPRTSGRGSEAKMPPGCNASPGGSSRLSAGPIWRCQRMFCPFWTNWRPCPVSGSRARRLADASRRWPRPGRDRLVRPGLRHR